MPFCKHHPVCDCRACSAAAAWLPWNARTVWTQCDTNLLCAICFILCPHHQPQHLLCCLQPAIALEGPSSSLAPDNLQETLCKVLLQLSLDGYKAIACIPVAENTRSVCKLSEELTSEPFIMLWLERQAVHCKCYWRCPAEDPSTAKHSSP